MRSKIFELTFLSFVCAVSQPASWADVYNVSMTTSVLSGDPAAPFHLEFQFNDGSGSNDGNNTVTLDQFAFGAGGAPAGSPSLTGGVTGDLSTTVSLTDSDFFNQFIEEFTPGDQLSFRLSLPGNLDTGGVPDEFSFAILDSTFTEIPTFGPFDVILLADIDSKHPVLSGFGSDSSRDSVGGGAPIDLPAPSISSDAAAVPEPTSVGLFGVPVFLAGILRRVRRSSPSRYRFIRTMFEKADSPASLIARRR